MYAGVQDYYCDDSETEQPNAEAMMKREQEQEQQKELELEPQKELGEEEEDDDFIKKVEEAIAQQRYEEALAPTICVVPRDLAEGNPRAYEPAVVCIGPFFYEKRETDASMLKLERYKWRCVRSFIINAAAGRRNDGEPVAGSWKPEVHAPLLRECLGAMRDLELQIAASYSMEEGSSLVSLDAVGGCRNLARMMLLDGCFLLHLLLKYARLAKGKEKLQLEEEDDDGQLVYGRFGIWGTVKRDLLLLNNQIPFFVLRTLLKHLKSGADEHEDDLIDGGLRLFRSLRPGRLVPSGPPIACGVVRHLLHLFYLSNDLPQGPRGLQPAEFTQRWVPCATELDDAGVTFRPRKNATSFLDVSFRARRGRGGVLEIPPLELFDNSEALFRNLIAFEQTYPHTPGNFTAYAIFMDCLVKTRKDMRLLQRRGVLVNHLNVDADVAATGFFGRVCAQAHTTSSRNYLATVMADVDRYQSATWPRWRAELARNYFSNPWVTTSVVAAVVLLILTVLQTTFTVYAYYKPPNQ